MQRLRRYIYRYRYQYLWGLLCLLMTATVQMTIPWLIKKSVEAIGGQADPALLSHYVLIIIGLAILLSVIRSFSRFLILNAGRNVESDLRDDLFAHLQKLSTKYYQDQRTGDLMSRLINDLSAVRTLVGNGLLNLINAPLYCIYAIPFMLSIDPGLTAATILPYFSILWVIKTYRERIRRMSLAVHRAMGQMNSRVHESVSGRELVKNYVLEEQQIKEFSDVNGRYRERSLALTRTRGLFSQMIRGVAGLSSLMVVWYGGTQVAQGELTIADLVAFLAYLYILARPSSTFGRVWALVVRVQASMQRIDGILTAKPDITVPANTPATRQVRGAIEFRHVHFAYATAGNGRPVLKDINFTVRQGTTLGIVGRTGAGKTTLVSLIPRICDVTDGEILLDGEDIRRIALGSLRTSIGMVPQDPFLFSTTLRRNIAFGLAAVEEEAILGAASIARLEEDLKDFPSGYDTMIGERGVMISGGQKQRTALARALILDPRILILDDALSSVDSRTERQILQGLKSIIKQRTTIVISHRVSSVIDADEILVLDNGEIVERGTHHSLVAQGGLYTDLFYQQELSEELERY